MAANRTWVIEAQIILKSRGYFLGKAGPNHDGIDGDPGDRTIAAVLTELKKIVEPLVAPPALKPDTLVEADYALAAAGLHPLATPRLIKTLIKVESGGAWFTDMRKDILDADGPGGFLDGAWLPKILFEAHTFHRLTGGKYDHAAPNVSSPVWNRALYVGGQGEYARLYRAMQLDRDAALKSASVGLGQIMGENYKLAGYPDVESYWADMKRSEFKQLKALCCFIKSSNLVDELMLVAKGNGKPFAAAYNGPAYAENHYDTKLVDAYNSLA